MEIYSFPWIIIQYCLCLLLQFFLVGSCATFSRPCLPLFSTLHFLHHGNHKVLYTLAVSSLAQPCSKDLCFLLQTVFREEGMGLKCAPCYWGNGWYWPLHWRKLGNVGAYLNSHIHKPLYVCICFCVCVYIHIYNVCAYICVCACV